MISQSGISVNQDNTNMSTIQLTNNANSKHLKRISFFIFYHTCGGPNKTIYRNKLPKNSPAESLFDVFILYLFCNKINRDVVIKM